MKIKYVALSCLLALFALASLFLLVEMPMASSATGANSNNDTWTDQFNSPTLDARWTWVREDPSHWSLTDQPGYLSITTQDGSLRFNSMRNVLLTEPTLDDFVITTKVTIAPFENVLGAYIQVYQDDDNYIYVGRRYGNGDVITFRHEVDGVYISSIDVPEPATTVYLRLSKRGTLYFGAYSTDGVTWTQIDKYYADFENIRVSIAASGGPSTAEIPADFDYFKFEAFDFDAHYVAPGGNCGGPIPCYETIQEAVDASDDLDQIKVSAGAYTGVHFRPRRDIVHSGVVSQVVYISKSVEIQGGFTISDWSIPDPVANPTILDAEGQGRVFYITGDVYPTISGLQVTGGDATGMHGEEHSDQDAGGGLYVITGTATIEDNHIFDNHAKNGVGGGLFLQFSDSMIKANAVYSNTADYGGGLGTEGGGNLRPWAWTIKDNLISGNETSDGGGGINTVFNRAGTIAGNTISDNIGGGLDIFVSDLVIKDNIITNNSGRGISFLGDSESTLVNNVISGNDANHDGTALRVVGVKLHLLHNTIANNTPADKSAIHVQLDPQHWPPATVMMTNTILADSDVGIKVTDGNTVIVNSILWHDVPQPVEAELGATVTVDNDIEGDPGFAADGYHLTSQSAAINKGIDAGVAEDIEGDPRPTGGGFDLGADEILLEYVYLPVILK